MAIARGAGTEIIRSILVEDINSTDQNLIRGVAHHIYTVLSITAHAITLATDRNYIECQIYGYDAKEGTSGEYMTIFRQDMSVAETFVWNDKFSFNGHEPTDFVGPMADPTKQDAIADQASGNLQVLIVQAENSSDRFDITCTFIDQNNA